MELANQGEIISKIYIIRGEKVMIDSDLAELYKRGIQRSKEPNWHLKTRSTLEVSANAIYRARRCSVVWCYK